MRTRDIDLGPLALIPRGEGRVFEVADRAIAVFRTRGDKVYATEAFCPHRQGPLADGFVGGGRVVCRCMPSTSIWRPARPLVTIVGTS